MKFLKRRKVLLVVIYLTLTPLLIFFLSSLPGRREVISSKDPVLIAIENIIKNPLEEIAEKNLLAEGEEYGIVVKNLKTGELFEYDGDKKFDSASLYKLWVMGAAFQKMSEGKIGEGEELRGNKKELNITLEIASPSAEPSKAAETEEEKKVNEISYTFNDGIEKMITFSDNYAALLVASRTGNLTIQPFIRSQGLKNSSFGQPPETTAEDTALLLEKIYKGEVVDKIYSQKMIAILKKQIINDRIPKYLPEETDVAHKTGELYGFKHDAGIVFSSKGDFIIVVLSKTDDSARAAEKIALFSKKVFDYYNGTYKSS